VEQVRLLIIDPNTLFREGLRGLLSGTQFDVAHEASDTTEGLEIVQSNDEIEIVILDFTNDGSDTELQILTQMRAANEDIKLIVLTNEMSALLLARALNAGADGFLLKSMSSEALVASLRLVVLGEKVFPTKLATMITSGQIDPTAAEVRASSMKGLSEREREIMGCLVHGKSNKVIARQLGITEATVKVHLKAVLRKLNVSNRTQAALWAVRNGLREGDRAQQ
jgi:two-component system nitrate/nitrite response regulator NarL